MAGCGVRAVEITVMNSHVFQAFVHCCFVCRGHWYVIVLLRRLGQGSVVFEWIRLNSIVNLNCHTTELGLQRWVARLVLGTTVTDSVMASLFVVPNPSVSCAQQRNTYDCGVYSTWYASRLWGCRGELELSKVRELVREVQQDEIDALRKNMREDLVVFQSYNERRGGVTDDFIKGFKEARLILGQLGGLAGPSRLVQTACSMGMALEHMVEMLRNPSAELDQQILTLCYDAVKWASKQRTTASLEQLQQQRDVERQMRQQEELLQELRQQYEQMQRGGQEQERRQREGKEREGQQRKAQQREGQEREGQQREEQQREGQEREGEQREEQQREGQEQERLPKFPLLEGPPHPGDTGKRGADLISLVRQLPLDQAAERRYIPADNENGT